MIVNPITTGIVLDHITAGRCMEIYKILGLDKLDCTVAIIKNADSNKMGKKDILKICERIDVDLEILGYIDPGITVHVIQEGIRIQKLKPSLPDMVTDVIKCKNPRCITSIEQELTHKFKLTDREKVIYRCLYCETKAKNRDKK